MKKLLILSVFMGLIQSVSAQSIKELKYADGTQELNGLVTSNAGKNLPGVLILPAWMGIDDEAKTAALQLEKEGYIAFVADIYGKGNIPTDFGSAGKIATQFKTDYKLYQKRISLALEQLKAAGAQSSKIAVIGYCFGGSGALETARAGFDVAGVVCIHGGLSKAADRPNGPIKTKILVENPAEDKGVKRKDFDSLVKEMNDAKADWQIITYANCGHTFTNPASKEYNEVMAKRAWNHTLLFLAELLK
ncbi:MAG TPA: dienelactone hydrolase [Prolixibacteraceae bacterium]|nr:dienelactone hydrolase [Prolixibacteraceae bacterium]